MRTFFVFVIFATTCFQALFSQTLTKREVFDLHPGDEMGIYLSLHPGPWEYSLLRVIKREELGTDALSITYFRGHKYLPPSKMTWVTEYDTFTVLYTQLNKPYFDQFDQHDTAIHNYSPNDSLKQYPLKSYELNDSAYLDSCNTWINTRYDRSYLILSGEYIHRTKVYKGLGVLYDYYEYETHLINNSERFVYYIKDGQLCGTKQDFPLSSNQFTANISLNIQPNPAHDYVEIESNKSCDYTIYNLQGQALLSGHHPGLIQTIDIRELNPGIYIVCLNDGHMSITKKLLVN